MSYRFLLAMSEAGDTYDMGGGYFLYDTCSSDLGINKSTHQLESLHQAKPQITHLENHKMDHEQRQLSGMQFNAIPNSGEYYCGQQRASLLYLQSSLVQQQIHVWKDTKGKNVSKENLTDGEQKSNAGTRDFTFNTRLNYNFNLFSLVDKYKDVLLESYDVVQYSGDADPCVPYIGTQRWIQSLVMVEYFDFGTFPRLSVFSVK